MRTFDENLDAYHTLNTLNALYVKRSTGMLSKAITEGEIQSIMVEDKAHWEEQGKLYIELGKEMAQIMSKKWWQFWK